MCEVSRETQGALSELLSSLTPVRRVLTGGPLVTCVSRVQKNSQETGVAPGQRPQRVPTPARSRRPCMGKRRFPDPQLATS